MLDGGKSFQRLLSHPLGGGFRYDQLRELLFQGLEFFYEDIEFEIRDLGIVVKIIFFLVIDNLFSQFLYALFCLN